MIRLVACDLDGTLLDGTHRLPIENAKAIHDIHKEGIEFLVATGRNYESVKPLLKSHDLQCKCLLLNGALLVDEKGTTLMEITLDIALVRRIIQIFQTYDICFHMYTRDGIAATQPERIRSTFYAHMLQQGTKKEIIEEMLADTSFCRNDIEIKDLETYFESDPYIYKIEAFCSHTKHMQAARQHLQSIEDIEVTNSIADNIEVTQCIAQKGTTLLAFCKRYEYLPKEVMVIGDSMNDLSMMKLFSHSVAMGNAHELIKDSASYITKSNVEFGVAEVLYGLLEKGIA